MSSNLDLILVPKKVVVLKFLSDSILVGGIVIKALYNLSRFWGRFELFFSNKAISSQFILFLFTLSYWERDDARRVHLVSEKKEKGHGISKTAEFWKINYILYGSGNAERCSQYRRQSSWSSSALLFYSVFVVISCSFVAAQINALIARVKYPKPGRVSLSGIGFGYGPPVPGVSCIG